MPGQTIASIIPPLCSRVAAIASSSSGGIWRTISFVDRVDHRDDRASAALVHPKAQVAARAARKLVEPLDGLRHVRAFSASAPANSCRSTGELPATTAGLSTGALASVGTDGTDVLAGSAVTEVKLPTIAATYRAQDRALALLIPRNRGGANLRRPQLQVTREFRPAEARRYCSRANTVCGAALACAKIADARLLQDLRAGQSRRLGREVRVLNAAARGRKVLADRGQVRNRRLEAVLDRAERAAQAADRGQRRVDTLHRRSSQPRPYRTSATPSVVVSFDNVKFVRREADRLTVAGHDDVLVRRQRERAAVDAAAVVLNALASASVAPIVTVAVRRRR